jgi:hypothetical protein
MKRKLMGDEDRQGAVSCRHMHDNNQILWNDQAPYLILGREGSSLPTCPTPLLRLASENQCSVWK